MPADDDDLSQQATDPTTDQSMLAQLAYDRADLRPLVALNPSAYEGLLTWLGALGDPAVDAALAARNAPPLPPPPAPSAVSEPAAAPDAPKAARARPSRKVIAITGGGVVVLAILVVVAVVLFALPKSSSGGISTVSIEHKPTVNGWSLDSPFPAALRENEDTVLNVEGYSIGQDAALIIWRAGVIDGDSTPKIMLSSINTRTGAVAWKRSWNATDSPRFVGNGDSGPILIENPDNSDLYALDRTSGAVVGSIKGLDGIFTDSLLTGTSHLGGDIVVAKGKALYRYHPSDLSHAVWTIKVPSGAFEGYAGGKLFTSTAVYSVDSGARLKWDGELADHYFAGVGDSIVTTEVGASTNQTGEGISPVNGAVLWKRTFGKGGGIEPLTADSVLAVDPTKGTIERLNVVTGKTEWSFTGRLNTSGRAIGMGTVENRVIFLPISSNNDLTTAIDVATGKRLYTVTTAHGGDFPATLVGSTPDLIYVDDPKTAALTAYGLTDGLERWTLPGIRSNQYSFFELGGNIVAIASSAPKGTKPLRGVIP